MLPEIDLGKGVRETRPAWLSKFGGRGFFG